MKTNMTKIGIDLGGTKIAAVALSDNSDVLSHARMATPQRYTDIVKACAELVHKIKTTDCDRVGICTPGVIDGNAGVIRFSPNVPAMKDQLFVNDLSAAIGMNVKLANDAACFALSEACDGAGADARVVYGVILGTGVGGAMVVDKKISSGPNGATEWGHVPLPWPDANDVPARCGCGRMGDIESYVSGTALHRQLAKKLGRVISNDELAAGIVNNNSEIMAVMNVYFIRLAKAFAMLITMVDPDVIVLGGGVSNLDAIYDVVPRLIGDYTLSRSVKTKILKARYGDDSGMRGAAWL
jgi:fructokinase